MKGATILGFTALVLAAGCRQQPPAAPDTPPAEHTFEFLHEPISQLEESDDGALALGLGPNARWFYLHPALSPDFDDLAATARAAHASGEPLHATVWIREDLDKAAGPASGGAWPTVVVRLADSPDPRAGR